VTFAYPWTLRAKQFIQLVSPTSGVYSEPLKDEQRATSIRILSVRMQSQSHNFHFLLHSAHLVEERLRKRLAPLGVQPRQARILDAIGHLGETSQIRLAEEMSVTQASMSTMIVRLVELGLITKRVDKAELRSNILSITRRGQKLLESIYQLWAETDREIEATIGLKNTKHLTDLTLKLRNALGGFTPGENIVR
jgi:DNA-binding MarR family transcriptional regulator